MMKKIVWILLGVLAFSACSREALPSEGEGCLRLKVDGAWTKTALTDEQLLSTAVVKIYKADFSGLVRSWRYGEIPSTIWLPADDYRVDVEAGEMVQDYPDTACWDQRSYEGSKEFSVVAGQATQVTVPATCCNAVSLVRFDSTVAANFAEGYTLTVTLREGASLTYTAADAGKEGYFLIGGIEEPAFSWRFAGRLKTGEDFVKSGTVAGIEAGKRYELKLKYIILHGHFDLDIQVDTTVDEFEDVIIFEPVSTGIAPSEDWEIWAGHATVHADVDSGEYDDPSQVAFEYAPAGSDNWISKAAVLGSDGSFSAVLTGLTPATEYNYRLVVKDAVVGDPVSLTTDVAPAVPNGSFEYTTDTGKYYEWYNASAPNLADRNAWWGSGNGSKFNDVTITGSAEMGYVISEPSSDAKDGSQSACLKSRWAVVKLAAGNIFTGYFGGLDGTKGGKVYYGRPWTARPTALRFWAKYETGNVNRVDGYPSGETSPEGKPDRARIYAAMGNWSYKTYKGTKDCPILVNTTDQSTFYNYRTMTGTIAYGELILSGSNGGWKQYTIPFDYNSQSEMPTHILISCASSMLGDYFTGCDSSKLWLDKMELIYE